MLFQETPEDSRWPSGAPVRMTRRLNQLDRDDLVIVADAMREIMRDLVASDERLVLRLTHIDWPTIQRHGIEDLDAARDIIRDALSLFRLTKPNTSARQPRKWWTELAHALVDLNNAIAGELGRRG